MTTDADQFSIDLVSNIPYLRAMAILLAKDHFLAEDVVQDTLERALANRHQFLPGTNLRGWLTIILRNRYFNIRRKRSFNAEVPMDLEILSAGRSGGQEERLQFRDVVRAFGELPKEQQRAIVMVGVEGLSYEETAEKLDSQLGTVKSRVSRGRTRLVELLEQG